MSTNKSSNGSQERAGGAFGEPLEIVATTITNPLFLFGIVFGGVVGWGLCWAVFVLPFHKNLSEREAQLEKWSQLNQQAQQLVMEIRTLSQTELKQFVAANQEAAASFQEVQRYLHERELRLTETPTSYILIPVAVLAVTCCGLVFFFKALNQRAMVTVDHVLQLAPREMVQDVVSRHVLLQSARVPPLLLDGNRGQKPEAS